MQKNPNTCQALANAIVHGLKWLQTAGPSDIIKTVPESYLLGDRALYLASFNKVREAISLDGLMPEEGARTALKALASFEPGIKADKIDLGRPTPTSSRAAPRTSSRRDEESRAVRKNTGPAGPRSIASCRGRVQLCAAVVLGSIGWRRCRMPSPSRSRS